MPNKLRYPKQNIFGKIVKSTATGLGAGLAQAGVSAEIDRISRRQDSVDGELQKFYRDQQAINREAIQEFGDLQDRTGALERQSDETRKFIKKQERINREMEDQIKSLTDEVRGEKKRPQED